MVVDSFCLFVVTFAWQVGSDVCEEEKKLVSLLDHMADKTAANIAGGSTDSSSSSVPLARSSSPADNST